MGTPKQNWMMEEEKARIDERRFFGSLYLCIQLIGLYEKLQPQIDKNRYFLIVYSKSCP